MRQRASRMVIAIVISGAVLGTGLPLAAQESRALATLMQRQSQRRERYDRELKQLVGWCEKNRLAGEAETTRRWMAPELPGGIIEVAVLPDEVAPGGPPSDASQMQKQWHRRARRIRRSFADDLFKLAATAVRAGEISYAFDLVHAVAELDPDHGKARTLLGYGKHKGRWLTPFERQMVRSGRQWDDRFGWIEARDLSQYERGLRPYQGKWVPAQEEARHRRNLKDGWEVRTEHYLVLTNHSLQAGVELGRRLEDLYRAFHRVFAGFFTPREQIARMFEGRARAQAPAVSKPFQVVYFRNRHDYVSRPTLRTLLGKNLEISSGAYIPDKRTAFFFYDPNGDGTTVLHEGTHQLFSESRGPAAVVGIDANFWIVEGIACYMESLRREGDRIRIGGAGAARFRDARYRGLKEGYHVPLHQLTAWGIQRFQSQPNLRPLYSQSAGLAHFLMHFDDGRYREPLVQYLQSVYSGSDTPTTLRELTNTTYGRLDEQYRAFLKVGK